MREAVQSGLEMFKYNLDIEQQSIIQMDTCLASWRSDDRLTTYLIAQSSYSNASYCLVYNPFSLAMNSLIFICFLEFSNDKSNYNSK
jgi:hypothetical protein